MLQLGIITGMREQTMHGSHDENGFVSPSAAPKRRRNVSTDSSIGNFETKALELMEKWSKSSEYEELGKLQELQCGGPWES